MPAGPAPHRRTLTLICAIGTVLLILLSLTEPNYDQAEQAARDWLQSNRLARLSPKNPRLVFLAIDDASKTLDTLFAEDIASSRALQMMKAGFPWNREVYALTIARLRAAGAQAVVFDMLFPNPREGDAAFAAALRQHGAHVVIGSNLKDNAEDESSRKPAHILPTPELLPPPGADSWVGFVNVLEDPDKVVRRVHYRSTQLEFFGLPPGAGSQELLSIAARALEKAGLARLIPPGHAPLLPRFSEEILPRSLHEIFVEAQWNAPPYNRGALFRDKIVVIGAAGNEAEDRLRAPQGTVLAPTIHLSAINAALNRDFLRESGPLANLALIAAAGALAWVLGAHVRRPVLRLGLLLLAAVFYAAAAQLLFNEFGLLPILLSPLLALGGSSITWTAWEAVLDRVERERTRRALERYVGHDVAREVLDNPASYLHSLGGQRKPVTILFSDIRGFTTMTETADPHALVAQLNEYFEEMVSIVFAHHGTLDKFIGDAVMAHWGSIVSQGPATDAARAVTAALQMRTALARLNSAWRERGLGPWKIGIGINHGEPISGNIGAAGAFEKFEFTVIGDAVNLASRLEGATKQYHLDLCLGEGVASLVREHFLLRSVDLILVKGKTRPVEVFTALDYRDAIEPPWLARHEEAVRLYRAGDFPRASAAWREVLAQAPGDGLAEVFLARCAELEQTPPAAPWTGVYEMKSK